MPSSEFRRLATISFFIMVPTRKFLPTSRRKSSALMPAVQSRLFTMVAAFSPSKER